MTRDTIIMSIVEAGFSKAQATQLKKAHDKHTKTVDWQHMKGAVQGFGYGGTVDPALREGFIKDVLTYDVGAHHPRPGRRAKHMRPASSRKKPTSQPLGLYDPKKVYPKTTSSSSAARKPGSAPKRKSKMGKRLAMIAAPYAAIAAYKGYKSLRDRVDVHKALRKAKKKDSQKKLKEAIVEMKMGRPYTLASNRRISFRRKHLKWPSVMSRESGSARMRDLKTKGMIRVVEDREALIKAIMEVVDDTYSAGVFGRGAREKKTADLIHKARKLKQLEKLKKRRVKVPQMHTYKKSWST